MRAKIKLTNIDQGETGKDLFIYDFPLLLCNVVYKQSRDKERQVVREKRKVFVTAHVILCMAAMFLANALNRGSHPLEILKVATNTGGEILLFRALANNMAPTTNH